MHVIAASDAAHPADSTPVVRCPSCAHPNPADSRFCNQCGMPVDFRHCDACDAINAGAADRCHKCGHSFVAPIFPAASTVTPPAAAQPSDSPRVLITLLALLGLVVLMFFAYQDNPQSVEPIALTYLEPTAMQIDTEPLAVDLESDARLAAYTRALPVTAKAKGFATTRKPANTAKAKPLRSSRAP